MAKITKNQFIQSAEKLSKQANGLGPKIGFTFEASGTGFTVCFSDKNKNLKETFDFAIEEFLNILNEANDEN